MVFRKVCVLVLSTKLASYDGASVNGRKKIVKSRNFFLIILSFSRITTDFLFIFYCRSHLHHRSLSIESVKLFYIKTPHRIPVWVGATRRLDWQAWRVTALEGAGYLYDTLTGYRGSGLTPLLAKPSSACLDKHPVSCSHNKISVMSSSWGNYSHHGS